MAKEEVSASEFAELKSDVHHMKGDVAEMKDSHKETSRAIQSISISLATLTAHVEQNSVLGQRPVCVDRVEREGADGQVGVAHDGVDLATGGLCPIEVRGAADHRVEGRR